MTWYECIYFDDDEDNDGEMVKKEVEMQKSAIAWTSKHAGQSLATLHTVFGYSVACYISMVNPLLVAGCGEQLLIYVYETACE